MRIGHGYDVHKFGDGDHVVLGGVRIEHSHGLIAHSDGDVLLHALSDALLGAAALGDIGKHFPDTDSAYENADSRVLLRHVVQLVANEGYTVSNVDVTLIAQAPRVSTFTDAMCMNIAADLGLGRTQVNVKATTTEKLGFIGEKKGIAAEAVALLLENKV
ncbi:2-C-methyl-D-erythritol 2,4-cyclodiphosphate synthase [BD1-7 clade bacterium]|uniref:2-C-methyl-D-erythritol 2,4-cyclodiphosphate synthase n=1 Tax=BD1-7 clade bacterium TaxID=2029982 RepID=A0A5S9PC72_9GAMM|nr:2-C-methyl-D-erythritol 2,4-cyclodiphosphate synthase [BD1-7 clade bacterium]CAA0102312.1 2-C-methyl-D-erythritol 2,4-cyclodiphosphate synthase [BD1-7 clade bacterium]